MNWCSSKYLYINFAFVAFFLLYSFFVLPTRFESVGKIPHYQTNARPEILDQFPASSMCLSSANLDQKSIDW